MKTQVKALKVKIKSLAEEARIIRLEERKALGLSSAPAAAGYVPSGKPGGPKKPRRKGPASRDPKLYLSLHTHRTYDVRREQRSALLAYAFIRGKAYAGCEKPGKDNPPDLERVARLVEKFGGLPDKSYKCALGTLPAWAAGTLDQHPFAPEVKAAAATTATTG